MGVGSITSRIIMLSLSSVSAFLVLLSVVSFSEGSLEGDFCSDVSYWDVIKYTSSTSKCCDTVVKEECKTRSERVCEDATEIKCNTVGWAECATKIWPSQGKKCHVTYKDFPYRDCKEEKYSVKHTKEVPECKTVTKDNCVTDWNIAANIKWADFVQGTTDIVEMKQECKVKSSVN